MVHLAAVFVVCLKQPQLPGSDCDVFMQTGRCEQCYRKPLFVSCRGWGNQRVDHDMQAPPDMHMSPCLSLSQWAVSRMLHLLIAPSRRSEPRRPE